MYLHGNAVFPIGQIVVSRYEGVCSQSNIPGTPTDSRYKYLLANGRRIGVIIL